MKCIQCLLFTAVVVCLYVNPAFSAPNRKGSIQQTEHSQRFRRDLGMSSWNIISPWEARTPCSHRMCWSDDDCCYGFSCVGISDWQDMVIPGTCALMERDYNDILDNRIDWS